MSKKANKKSVSKPIPFPKELFVQNSLEDGNGSDGFDNWLVANETHEGVKHGVRCAVYVLKEVVVIDKHETFTTTKSR